MKAHKKKILDRYGQEALDRYMKSIKDIKSFKDAPSMGFNPFITNLSNVIEMKNVVKGSVNKVGKASIIDRETGEITDADENRVFVRKEYVDNDKFVKIFQRNIKEMFSLTHPGIKVFGFFLDQMQKAEKDTDFVYFDLQACMEFCEYSTHRQVYLGLTELIKKGFVAKTERHPFFYINPDYSFNGKRIIVFEEYINKSYMQRQVDNRIMPINKENK